MNLNTVKAFRHDVYQSFKQAKDALFNVLDALASEDRAKSLPELSLSPHFQRKWPSVYEALEDGHIERSELQQVFAKYLPCRTPMPIIAIDSSGIARPKARTSADRSAQYVHNLPESAKPITYGWQFSTVVALPEKPSGWTYTLDQCRVETTTTAISATVGTGSPAPCNDHCVVGSWLRLGLAVVQTEHLAHSREPHPFEKQSLLLSTGSGSHGQTWSSTQTRRQGAAQGSSDPH